MSPFPEPHREATVEGLQRSLWQKLHERHLVVGLDGNADWRLHEIALTNAPDLVGERLLARSRGTCSITEFEKTIGNDRLGNGKLSSVATWTVTLSRSSQPPPSARRSTATIGFVLLNRSSAAPSPAPTSRIRSSGPTRQRVTKGDAALRASA